MPICQGFRHIHLNSVNLRIPLFIDAKNRFIYGINSHLEKASKNLYLKMRFFSTSHRYLWIDT